MSIYAVCFSVIKSCTYWESSTLQALREHAYLFYEKCNVEKHRSANNIALNKLTTTSSFLMHFVAFLLHELIQTKY